MGEYDSEDAWANSSPDMPAIFTTANISDTARNRYIQASIAGETSIAPSPASTTPGILGGLKNWLSGTPFSLAWKSNDEIVQKAKTDAEKSSFFGSIGDWFSGTLTKVIVILALLFVGFFYVKHEIEK